MTPHTSDIQYAEAGGRKAWVIFDGCAAELRKHLSGVQRPQRPRVDRLAALRRVTRAS
jgi:hypothetical protein